MKIVIPVTKIIEKTIVIVLPVLFIAMIVFILLSCVLGAFTFGLYGQNIHEYFGITGNESILVVGLISLILSILFCYAVTHEILVFE